MISTASRIFSHKDLKFVWAESRKRFKATCSGIDSRTVDQIEPVLNRYITDLRKRLSDGYKVEGLLGIPIVKANSGKCRIICVPTYADRLIQFSIQDSLRPEMKKLGIENKVSFGVVRGTEYGVEQARNQACKFRSSKPWVYKTDIVSFFDEIPRAHLKELISSRIKQKSLHKYLYAIVDAEVTRGVGSAWKEKLASTTIKAGKGIRQGMPLSPLLSAFYLVDLDKKIISLNIAAVRYADDFVAFFNSEDECLEFHALCKNILSEIGLAITDQETAGSKTKIYAPSEPAEFLGMEITPPKVGRCKLILSDDRLSAICDGINQISSIDYLNSNKIRFQALESHASSVTRGLINAYRTAHNHCKVAAAVNAASEISQDKILADVFGQKFLNSLEPKKRIFLGLKIKA